MQMRTLGSSGLRVSAVGLGCMGITHASGAPMSKKDGVEVIREAYEMGYNFLIPLSVILASTLMVPLPTMRKWWAMHCGRFGIKLSLLPSVGSSMAAII